MTIAEEAQLAGLATEVAALNARPEPGFFDVAAAKAAASEAATIAARASHQAHGAIGMTKEYELGQLSRRLWSWRDEFGSERYWSRGSAGSWRRPAPTSCGRASRRDW